VIYISGGMAELRLWISYPAFLARRIFGVSGILGMANIRCIRHSWHGEYSYISEVSHLSITIQSFSSQLSILSSELSQAPCHSSSLS